MATLRELIEGFHRRNPDFPRPTPAPASDRTSSDASLAAGASLPCAQTRSEAGPVPVLDARDDEARWTRTASQIGIGYHEYRQHDLAGDRWCSGHREFHPAELFYRNRKITYCIALQDAMVEAALARRQERAS
jgi:hypothetical protein